MGYFKINKLRFKLLIMESEKVQALLLKLKSTEFSSLQQNLFAAFCNIKTGLWIFCSIHLFLTIVTSSIIMVVKDKRQKRELSHLFSIQGHFPAESLCVCLCYFITTVTGQKMHTKAEKVSESLFLSFLDILYIS